MLRLRTIDIENSKYNAHEITMNIDPESSGVLF